MEKANIKVSGPFLNDFQMYLEDQQVDGTSRYQSLDFEEVRRYGDGKQAGVVEVLMLSLTISLDLVKDLFKDYIKDTFKQKKHSAVYKLKNDNGEELTVSLNNLDINEINKLVNEFRGNIVEIAAE